MAIKTDTFSSAGGGGAGTDNLDDVTTRGATTTNAITVGGVTVGTEYSLPTLDGSANQVLQTNGTGTVSFATLDFTGGLEYKGSFNATAGTPSLLNAEKGDFYIIDTAGTIYGQTWAVGDHLLINADMGGTITNSKIDKIDNTQAVTSVNTQTGAVVVSGNDLLADHTAVNYTAANNNIDGHLSGIDSALGASATPTLDGVTTNGNTTTNAINVGTITTSGDILADSDDTRTIGAEATRFITYHGDMNGAIRFKAKNNQGTAISKGQAVYISGVSGTVPEVKLAQANSALTMPAFGLALENANNLAEVQIITFGNLTDYNTTTYSLSANDTVFVSAATAGALVNSAPTGEGNLIQNIGRVVRADASAGIIKVGGAGRSAATPNLNNGNIFIGNASNQSSTTALSGVAVTSFNTATGDLTIGGNDLTADHTAVNYTAANANIDGHFSGVDTKLGTLLADITSESLNDLSDVSFTAGAGIDNYVLTYDNTTNSWGAEVVPSAPVTSVNTQTGAVVVSGNDILADHTAVNYTASNNNVDGHFSGVDTKLGTLLADITSESLNDLSDVSYTAGAGIDNYVLTYDNTTNSWGAEAVPGGSPASETTAGIIEIATNAEATAGTATDKALVPSNLSSVDLSVLDNTTSAFITSGDIPTASETTAGIIEIATNAEAGAGITTDKALVPSNISSLDLSAMNNTTSAFISNITSESLNDLSDVSFTAGAGIDNYVLTYDHATTSWGAEASAGGGGGYTYSAITADPANAQYDYHYSCTGTFTVTLPASASGDAGKEIRIKNMGTGTITVDGNASETIDGQTTIALDVQYSSITLIATGNTPAAWEIV